MEAFFNHLNPAIIRSVMLKMNRKEFQDCMEFIKKKALELPNGTKREMYLRLFHWSDHHYKKVYQKNKPSLF